MSPEDPSLLDSALKSLSAVRYRTQDVRMVWHSAVSPEGIAPMEFNSLVERLASVVSETRFVKDPQVLFDAPSEQVIDAVAALSPFRELGLDGFALTNLGMQPGWLTERLVAIESELTERFPDAMFIASASARATGRHVLDPDVLLACSGAFVASQSEPDRLQKRLDRLSQETVLIASLPQVASIAAASLHGAYRGGSLSPLGAATVLSQAVPVESLAPGSARLAIGTAAAALELDSEAIVNDVRLAAGDPQKLGELVKGYLVNVPDIIVKVEAPKKAGSLDDFKATTLPPPPVMAEARVDGRQLPLPPSR